MYVIDNQGTITELNGGLNLAYGETYNWNTGFNPDTLKGHWKVIFENAADPSDDFFGEWNFTDWKVDPDGWCGGRTINMVFTGTYTSTTHDGTVIAVPTDDCYHRDVTYSTITMNIGTVNTFTEGMRINIDGKDGTLLAQGEYGYATSYAKKQSFSFQSEESGAGGSGKLKLNRGENTNLMGSGYSGYSVFGNGDVGGMGADGLIHFLNISWNNNFYV